MVASSPRPAFLCSGQVGGPNGSSQPRGVVYSEPAAVQGRVYFTTHRGEPAEAILDASGMWRCPQLPILDRVLNALFAPDGEEDDLMASQVELIRVAAWIKGRVWMPLTTT